MKTYFSDEPNKTTVSEDGLRVREEFYPLDDIKFAVSLRWFNWEGMAVFFGVPLALFAFTSTWIPWIIAIGLAAFGIYDVRLPRYKLWVHTHDSGIQKTAVYSGKGAKEAVDAIETAIKDAQADAKRAETGDAPR
jgi:Family of unknown function (DUF6232)